MHGSQPLRLPQALIAQKRDICLWLEKDKGHFGWSWWLKWAEQTSRFAETEPMGRNTMRKRQRIISSHMLSLRCLKDKLIIANILLSADTVSDTFYMLSSVISAVWWSRYFVSPFLQWGWKQYLWPINVLVVIEAMGEFEVAQRG